MSEDFPVTQLAELANITMGQSPGSEKYNKEEQGLPFLQGCAEFGPRNPDPETYCHPPLRIAKQGSILISVRAPVGTMNMADQDYCIGRGLCAIQGTPGVAVTPFLLYAIKQNAGFLHRRSQGSTFLAIGSDDLKRLPVPKLDIKVQECIAEILTTVEQAIEKTESLIAKYQQVKAGLMHDLFTRGITADGKLRPPREKAPELYKETPIGWIPKEWDVYPLGKISEIVSGVTLGEKRTLSNGIIVPYLRVANVQDGFLDLTEVKTVTVSAQELEKLRLKAGDVLMNEGGDFDKLGRGTVWRGEISNCVHQNHVFRVRPRTESLRSDYLAFWSQSQFGKKYFVMSSKQSTNLASINSTQLHTFPIAVPVATEQARIENRIIATITRIESVANEFVKLNSIKNGLMHDLLTGRVLVVSE